MEGKHTGSKTSAAECYKVRFSVSDSNQHNSEIKVEPCVDDRIGVHLGFLKVRHQYELRFRIKDNLYEDLTADPLQNLHCRVLSIIPSDDGEGHEVVIDFNAHKEKLVREELRLTELLPGGKQGRSVLLTLNARVLGKGMGTPSIKFGIRLIGCDPDDESGQSDWAGIN